MGELEALGDGVRVFEQALTLAGEPEAAGHALQLADALPNATYRSLPGRAHLPYLEAPDELAALIMAEVV